MLHLTRDEWKRLGEAILVWTGRHTSHFPARSDERVVQQYGASEAALLLPLIHEAVSEFYASDAWRTAKDLVQMGELAAARFIRMHPDAPEDAVEALANCYTYDYK